MSEARCVPTPMVKESLKIPENDEAVQVPFRQVVGSLMYLAHASRPDITFAVITVMVLQLSRTALMHPRNRLSEADLMNYNYPEPTGPGSYAYGYDIEDPATNNVQFKNEERYPNGSVTGSYGYLLPDGNVQKVSYVADSYGYRASVEVVPRGIIKPVQLDVPENQLFDFSATSPKPAIFAPTKENLLKLFPHNIPNYISVQPDKNNLQSNQKIPWGRIPYYTTLLKTPASFKQRFDNHYLVPI